jgi:REP element-mobilizing transposase RayT
MPAQVTDYGHAARGSGTGILPVTEHGQDGHATSGETGILPVKGHGREPDGPVQVDHSNIRIRQGAYLPHWTSEHAIYAVTSRLADSLPRSVVESWEFERQDIVKTARQMNRPLTPPEEARLDTLFSERVETYLDAGAGECWMRRDDVAGIVASALRHFDTDRGTGILPVESHGQDVQAPARYHLFAWCVMPNHVHTVVQSLPGYGLPRIVHSWKSYTANSANRVIGRAGQFWQPEPYDHLIRDEEDFHRQVEYVLSNPVRAGLKNWKWVSG